MTHTDLDIAHAEMEAAPQDDAARLRFYERLADSELFMLLSAEADGDQIEPAIFEADGMKIVPVFDREARLAEFTGRAAPYVALPGRALVQMLDGQDVGLGLNLQVAPSQMLVPAEALTWLVATLLNAPIETQARIMDVSPPTGLPQAILQGLDRKLAIAAGLAKWAYLAAATYEDGTKGHVLAFVDAVDGAENALAHAASEALTFSGIEAGVMDVMFVGASDPLASHLAKVGLRFDLPQKAKPEPHVGPGLDPEKPPRLR